jgi:hypothetical protein
VRSQFFFPHFPLAPPTVEPATKAAQLTANLEPIRIRQSENASHISDNRQSAVYSEHD